MNDKPHSDKSEAELQDRAWELAKSIGTCMLVTWDGEKQRARPMTPALRREEHAIHFLTDKDAGQIGQEKRFPRVMLTFADTGGNKFVAITGEASVSQDKAKIAELWNPAAKAWWGSPDDPAIRVVTVTPDEAELWDSPGKLIATAVILTAALIGKRPSLGETARVPV